MKIMKRNLKAFMFSLVVSIFAVQGAFASSHNQCVDYKGLVFSNLSRDYDFSETKILFVDTFYDYYKGFDPKKIKDHFKSPQDIKDCLNGAFDGEVAYYQKAVHPMYWILLKGTDSHVIGFAIFEEWGGVPSTWHIRQIAINSQEQNKGYGGELLWSINHFVYGVKRVICDTREINTKARNFYRKHGFKEFEKPHDPDLDPVKYLGLEWKKS